MIDDLDRRIIDRLQDGLPIVERPFAAAAGALGISETTLIARLRRLLDVGVLSRVGPMYDAERLGGAVTLAAMAVPADRFDEVAAIVNAHREVAYNYARQHALNMWFVVAADSAARVGAVIAAIERETGLAVLNLPKLQEFRLNLRLAA
jgi:DNA-binding Lrp family transcriptional regulator